MASVHQLRAATGRPFSSKSIRRYIPRTRVQALTPLVWNEIQTRYSDAEYFTRDHLLYFTCMRQFSMAYRISLVRFVVRDLISDNKLLKFNTTDFAINSPENNRRYRTAMRNPEVAYSGSYTTRSADELLSREKTVNKFDLNWLADWLDCLSHLSDTTKSYYVRRIVDDLVRRGVLTEHPGKYFTVNDAAIN